NGIKTALPEKWIPVGPLGGTCPVTPTSTTKLLDWFTSGCRTILPGRGPQMGQGACQKACFVLSIVLIAPGAVRAGVNVWTSHGPDGGGVRALVIDPQDPGTVYALTPGSAIFRSTDGGTSWSGLNPVPYTFGITLLVVDPRISGTLYVGTYGD